MAQSWSTTVGRGHNMFDIIIAILLYLFTVMADGDYLNDWLTHVPADLAPYLESLGRALAAWMGV
jgi:hypothetical protein